jgi:sulfate adenylyltransferase subunit 1 (EFTu-like GTPase family)
MVGFVTTPYCYILKHLVDLTLAHNKVDLTKFKELVYSTICLDFQLNIKMISFEEKLHFYAQGKCCPPIPLA